MKKRIIGIDAGMLGIDDQRLQAGVWRLAFHTIRVLSHPDPDSVYRLYSFFPIPDNVMKQFSANVENRVLMPRRGWMYIRLPYELILRPVDVFIGLSQALPPGPGKKIGVVFDMAFARYPDMYPGSARKLLGQTDALVRRADHIIAISGSTRQELISRYGPVESRITVAYPGVDPVFTSRIQNKKTGTPYILSVGSLKPGKQIPKALGIFARYRQLHPGPLRYIITGSDYWMDPEISRAVSRLGLGSAVELRGYVADEELAVLYRGARALLITSAWEGFCFPAAEAMTSGCPVVYTPVGALPEVVGDAGISIDADRVADAAKQLHTILTDEKTRAAHIRAGLARSRQFNWETMGKSIRTLMGQLTEGIN